MLLFLFCQGGFPCSQWSDPTPCAAQPPQPR